MRNLHSKNQVSRPTAARFACGAGIPAAGNHVGGNRSVGNPVAGNRGTSTRSYRGVERFNISTEIEDSRRKQRK